jgi:hypothetical protein
VSLDQIRGIFAPYGEIADLNVMPPKKDGAMGEAARGHGWQESHSNAGWMAAARQQCRVQAAE